MGHDESMKQEKRRRWCVRFLPGLVILGWLSNTTNLLQEAADKHSVFEAKHQAFITSMEPNNNTISFSENSWKNRVRWDARGDKVGPPRFLLGIMSFESHSTIKGSKEFDRREMIRETYLRYYKDHGDTNEAYRICGIHEIVHHQIDAMDCQIAYAFVVGQSTKNRPLHGQTELLNASKSVDMIRSHPTQDILSLDIVENGKFGKSPTWFRYATLLRKELGLPFHYVVKTDSDTLLIPARFLRWVDKMEEQVDYERLYIYGGTPLDKVACGWPDHEHCNNMTAPYFHGGGFYFASIDVSEYIVSDRCPRKELFIPHEDVTMGNYVFSLMNETGQAIVGFKNPSAYHDTWRHPIKDPKRMRTLWRHYISKKKQRMRKKRAVVVASTE